MTKELFGFLPDGRKVWAYTLIADGMRATILSLGGILVKFIANGYDIVAGYDTLDAYLKSDGYLGALIGRCANRIRGGSFMLNGKTVTLNKNERNKTHLHGGSVGFDSRLWEATQSIINGGEALTLTLVSPSGEEHYPGTVHVRVTYALTKDGLSIHYQAVADADTPFNMTNHSYFNLDGYNAGSVLNHTLCLHADQFDAVDEDMIPVQRRDVAGTPFDFRIAKPLGQDIDADDEQLRLGSGYDHNFEITRDAPFTYDSKTLYLAATLSGIFNELRVYTDMPCIQIYTANFMGGEIPLKGGVPKCNRNAVCLETQYAPDSPNHGQAILRAGKTYDHTTFFAVTEYANPSQD